MPLRTFKKGTSRVNKNLIRVRSKLRKPNTKKEEKKPISPLIFVDNGSESGMLRLFQLVEDTLLGLLGFIERMIRTFFYALFKPKRIWEAVQMPEKESPLVRPLTFLFLSILLLISVEDNRLPIANSRQLEMTLKDITILEVAKFYVPVFMCSMALILLLSYICSLRDKERSFRTYVFITSYSLGLFYYCSSLLVYSFVAIFDIFSSGASTWATIILFAFLVYLIFVRSFKTIFFHLRFFSNRVVNILARGMVIFFIGIISIWITVFGSQLELEWGENIEERKIEYISINYKSTPLQITKDNYATTYLFISNALKDKIYLKRDNPKNILVFTYKDPETNRWLRPRFDYQIEDWASSNVQLMELPINEEKWIQIKFKLHPEFKNDISGIVFHLNFINISGQEKPRYIGIPKKDTDTFKEEIKALP